MTEPPIVEPVFKKPPPSGDHEPPPKPKRYWWRFTLASMIIVTCSAAAVSVSGILFANSIASAISHNLSDKVREKLDKELAEVNGGGPENILILGSDKRANLGEERGRSDTTMLLRLDPEKGLISVLSIPRDLKVDIPGVGIDKFNAAYAEGGPTLTLQVVKELTGLQINHVVNVDFLGFVRAVDAINCVYVDVDRRYYHSNVGVPPSEQYSEIDIKPGYQLLCGKKALEYVRYRHTDTDIVRSARQQDFLSQARQEIPLPDLLTGQNELLEIFTNYTTSDISSGSTLIRVLDLLIESRNATVNQVHFPAELGPSYVYASEGAIQEAVREFMGETESGESEASSPARKKGGGKGAHARGGGKHSKPKPVVKPRPPGSDGLVPAREAGEMQAKAVARKTGSGFPVFYPTRLPPGAGYVENDSYEHIQNPRVYHLRDTDQNRHGAYRMVAEYQPEYELDYFGIQGIQGWSDPPILKDPSETRTIHGREYEIFVDGDSVKLIAWHRGENTYWVSNSLQQSLTNEQMVGIARSAKVIIPSHKKRKGG
jgi:polyisoprenyl-teichoic acid--peptidoglycan teichoic acid transferase